MNLQEIWNFYFSFDWCFFFAFECFQWELSVSRQQIFTISYCFPGRRGQSGGWWVKIQFLIIWKNLTFHTISMGFLPNDFSWKMQKSYSKHFLVKFTVFCIKRIKGLCPAYYCVQQNTVSTLTQRFICSSITFQHTAVVSCWACEAPEFIFGNIIYVAYFHIRNILKTFWRQLHTHDSEHCGRFPRSFSDHIFSIFVFVLTRLFCIFSFDSSLQEGSFPSKLVYPHLMSHVPVLCH